MRLIYGDLFSQVADCIAITTNGFVKKSGEAVMGRGVAAEAVKHFKQLPRHLGNALRAEGNKVNRLTIRYKEGHITCHAFLDGLTDSRVRWDVVSFPVKPVEVINNGKNVVSHMRSKFHLGDRVPGWAAKADIKIIAQSCLQLVDMADKVGWRTIVVPRPGCGAGELTWEEVEPVLETAFDDRFSIISIR